MTNGDATALIRSETAPEKPAEAADSEQAILVRGDAAPEEPTLSQSLGNYVQAHLGRASKFADGKTRDWSVFFFFRVLPQAVIDGDAARLRRLWPLLTAGRRDDETSGEIGKALAEIFSSIKNPALIDAGSLNRSLKARKPSRACRAPSPGRVEQPSPQPDPSSQAFRGLLAAVAEPEFEKLREQWRGVLSKVDEDSAERPSLSSLFGFKARTADERAELIRSLLRFVQGEKTSHAITALANKLHRSLTELPLPVEISVDTLTWAVLAQIIILLIFEDPVQFASLFEDVPQDAAAAGHWVLKGGLPAVCLYEVLRQLQPALLKTGKSPRAILQQMPAIVRSELRQQKFAEQVRTLKRLGDRFSWDPVPVNYVFTFSGLSALGLDPATLASFPDPFKQGMAARAGRLGDIGPSAPENWDGLLGLNTPGDSESVHGYFTGGFLVGEEDTPGAALPWQALRDDVDAFNARSARKGEGLRVLLNFLFRWFGVEVVHIELGESPYEVGQVSDLQRTPYRKEHFGFADGVSQPFVYLGPEFLLDPPAGGGTPGPNRTWAPVAAGEIYLSEPDEDNLVQIAPVNSELRKGATYVVFRKLEQNVPEFRAYLASQRPKDAEAQTKLASEFVGRWPNGAPLVLSPEREPGLGPEPQDMINNFLYAADDPKGMKCPHGSHIRRTNPRDIGGANDVRRHRILRRSIAYGGPLLPEGSMGDGRKRGLLFIALNARIDLQFELVQSRWINTGEFLGQAGLNRCPIAGANEGGLGDAFLEAGAIAPVVDLPRFVVTRGGDYFFAPGVEALLKLARGEAFPPDGEGVPFDGYSMAGAYSPSLFDPLLDPGRLEGYGQKILAGDPSVIRIEAPPPASPADPASGPVAFVGQHADVVKVLSLVPPDAPLTYSTVPYREAGRRITRGHDLLEGTEPGNPPSGRSTQDKYERLHAILDEAWKALSEPKGSVYERIEAGLKGALNLALSRVETMGAADLVTDLALACVYEVIGKVFGVPGPPWVTELAVAAPFCRQHFGELPADWLKTVRAPSPPPNPGLATLQTWSIAIVFDLVANYGQLQELMAISDQAAGEFLDYLDTLLSATRANALARPARQPSTLVEAFVANEGKFVGGGLPYESSRDYYFDVATLLLDLAASALAFIPNVFGYAMDAIFDFGLSLHDLLPALTTAPRYGERSAGDGLRRLIYETCRLSPHPPASILMRTCVRDDTLPSGGIVRQGDFVAAMVGAAGLDPRAFPDAEQFSLHPFLPGPERNLKSYLLFGVDGTGRYCWGRDKLALLALEQCLKAAGRLRNLRRAAGPAGVLQTNLGTNIGIATGLSARFDGLFPDWPAH